MFREYVILLCAGSFVSGIAAYSGDPNATAKSQAPASGAAQQQDPLALPSQNSYQKVAAPSSYQVNSAVVDNIAEATQEKRVPMQYYGSPNVQQQTVSISASIASDPSSPEYKNILERYFPTVEPIKPYFAGPVAAKTVSVGSQEAANSGQGTLASDGYVTKPFVVYTNNATLSGQYYAVPSTQTVIEQQRTISIHPPSSHGTKYGAPTVAYPTNSAPRPFHPANNEILESNREIAVQSPAVVSYQVNQVQAPNPPAPQYHPVSKITYNVEPAVKIVSEPVPDVKKVTIQAYNSVQTHPPPAPKYAPASIPVPVIYQQLESHYPAEQQVVVVPTSASYAQATVGVQHIPMPVYTTNGPRLQYHSIPVAGGHQQGYAKAVLFSPASEVSRVVFNGLGVSYGW